MHAANVRSFLSSSNRLERLGHFLSHYLEMVAVMLLGMVVLGGPLRALLLSGHEDPLMHAQVRAYAVATLSLVVWGTLMASLMRAMTCPERLSAARRGCRSLLAM